MPDIKNHLKTPAVTVPVLAAAVMLILRLCGKFVIGNMGSHIADNKFSAQTQYKHYCRGKHGYRYRRRLKVIFYIRHIKTSFLIFFQVFIFRRWLF